MKKLFKNFDFWHWFGILAAFAICIWISFTVFNRLSGKSDFQLEADAEFFDFQLPPFEGYKLDKFEHNYELGTLGEMMPEEIENKEELVEDIFFYTSNKYPKNYLELIETYKSFWRFKIKNSGTKAVKNIALEIPFSGKCLITKENEESDFMDFNHKITIVELIPSEEVTILIWSFKNIAKFVNYVPQNIKVVCSEGYIDINYPVIAPNIVAWNARNNNYPLIFSFGGLLVLILLIITLSYHFGLNSDRKMNVQR